MITGFDIDGQNIAKEQVRATNVLSHKIEILTRQLELLNFNLEKLIVDKERLEEEGK